MSAVDFIKDWAQLIVVVLAAGGALLTLWRKVARPLSAITDIVELQLKPNGGGSLVDKVNKIATNHIEAQRHWEQLEANDRDFAFKFEERGQVIDQNHADAQEHWESLEAGQVELNRAFNTATATKQAKVEIIERVDALDTKLTEELP